MGSKSEDGQNDMEEAGGRKCGESRVEDQGSCRSNEMEGRCESDCGRDEVYPATFGDEERAGLKLDMVMMMLMTKNFCFMKVTIVPIAVKPVPKKINL